MAQDTNYAYPLAQFALTNAPTLISQKNASLAGLFPGSWGFGDDPTKKQLAQSAPTTLKDPPPVDILGGAISKLANTKPMSPYSLMPGLQGADTHTDNIGNFGDVNTTAHNDTMGAPATSNKPGFWDSKGGSILSSLLGIIALGGLGAGIGAISGGGRGAARGASYGMGLGTLQDLALRKQGMEAPANAYKLETEAYKAMKDSKSSLQKDAEYWQNNPEMRPAISAVQEAKSPFGAANLALRQQSLEKIPASTAMLLGEGKNIPTVLGSLRDFIGKNKDIMGPVAGRVSGWNPYSERGQILQGKIDSAKQIVGKFMEGGVLRKEDEIKYNKILGSIASDPASAIPKLSNLEKDLMERYDTYLGSLSDAGYNVSNYQKPSVSNMAKPTMVPSGNSKATTSNPKQRTLADIDAEEAEMDRIINGQ